MRTSGDAGDLARWKWLAVVFTGLALRLGLWWFTLGTDDVRTWSVHGLRVATGGLAGTYRNFLNFNHPPLMGLYAYQAWLWAAGDLLTFARLIKLPGLFGEALTVWALWRFAGRRASAAYARLPAAILVSGYHGNTDCLCAALVLVAAIAFEKERYFVAGLLWSAALNVKALPLVLIPLVILGVPNLQALARLAAGGLLGMIPFLPPAILAGSAMYRNIISYNSLAENWGVMALLNRAVDIPILGWIFDRIRYYWFNDGRYLTLLAVATIGLLSKLRSHMPMTEQAALGAVIFLVLAPGFGVQYVMFAAPLLCLVDLPEGLWWGWSSGIFIGAVYLGFLVSWTPMESRFKTLFTLPGSALGLLAWTVLLHFAWRHIRATWWVEARQVSPARA